MLQFMCSYVCVYVRLFALSFSVFKLWLLIVTCKITLCSVFSEYSKLVFCLEILGKTERKKYGSLFFVVSSFFLTDS